jgi:hypothetical protein
VMMIEVQGILIEANEGRIIKDVSNECPFIIATARRVSEGHDARRTVRSRSQGRRPARVPMRKGFRIPIL